MEVETLKHIFDPFYTTKGPGQGTGLGLAVVHGIVKAHDGFVTVRSEPGRGSQFQVYFPAVDEAAEATAGSGAPRPSPPAVVTGAPARVLLVDDEPPVVKICSRLLQRNGLQVQAFTAPDQALAEFRREPGAFDLVITDMSMPQMNGIDFALAIHATRSDVPVILTTGFAASLTEETAQSMGISALLTKPVGSDELIATVRRVLASRKGTG
jgi:CheY-like chemotaxis protein